jgi:hypothetical protein
MGADGVRLVFHHDGLPARGGDLLGGRAAELGRMHVQRLGQLAVRQHLDAVELVALDQSLLA